MVNSGLISESHYIDARCETGSSLNARKETVKHLASFSIDGAALLIGVKENKLN